MAIARRRLLIGAAGFVAAGVAPGVIFPGKAATVFKETMTTMFWVGEAADAENAFIANNQSYWDKDWQHHFGGVDHPFHRDGHWPQGFTPKENPFYVALPYGEFTEAGKLKSGALAVPWFDPEHTPLLKNHWVEIAFKGRSCFAQWQDVGPCGEDDFGFVFGDSLKPRNKFDARAGLDVSPAVWHYLGMTENQVASWRFVDARDVPPGPWTEIVTLSGNNR